MESNLKSVKGFIDTTRAILFRQAAEQKCVHPFRLTATNAFKQVLWLAAVELDDEDKTHIISIRGPEWGSVKFPVTLELEDANGMKLVAVVSAPEREYLQ